jgi:pyruvate formate lyase activating enzyme
MQGCNLRCPWCANPEGFETDGVVMRKQEGRFLRLSCEEWELQDFLYFCQESSPLFFDGGGVTFTGGEPTMQADILMAILNHLREAGIHTAVETNGTSAILPAMFPIIDQLIMDFKTADMEKHQRLLGPGGETLVENVCSALENHQNLIIRIPLIHDFNTSDNDMEGFFSVIGEGPKPHASFEFLTYHEYGRDKWRQCGLEYPQQGKAYVPEERRVFFEDAFRNRRLQVVRT